MDELLARTPCADLLPRSVGALALHELECLPLTFLLPFAGQAPALAELGVTLPDVGWQVPFGGGMLRWFGRDGFLCVGADLPEGVEARAAVSDQSDAWARMVLSGPALEVEAVLARLVPVDLRGSQFGLDQTCRTLLGHMNASITRPSMESFEVMVFGSMAATAVHEIAEAMGHVAARSSNQL